VHWLVSLALGGVVWSSSHPDHFIPWETDPVTHLMETWWPRAGLDVLEKRNYLTCVGSSSPLLIHNVLYAVPAPMELLDLIKL
jgi:hypothetical protein